VRDLVLLAGGTGLAPLKALVEQVAIDGGQRRVTLFVGARTQVDLYDLAALESISRELSWLTVVPALSNDPWHRYQQGTVVDVALRLSSWQGHDVYVCGSADMVGTTRARLLAAGLPVERVRCEDYTDDPYRPATESVVADFDEVPIS
jgi:NAD(P)H-flavin reductase